MEQHHPGPEQSAHVTKIEFRDNSPIVPIVVAEAFEQTREAILAHSDQLKQRALEILPGHEGGDEVASIDAYYERQGLETKPAKILTPEELAEFRAELANIGYSDDRLNTLGEETADGRSDRAIFLPQLGLIVAVRWPEHEGTKGDIYFRYLLAHEKAHSTSDHQDIVYSETEQQINYSVARVGHMQLKTGRGSFLEEGFADFMAARYVRDELNLPNGVWPTNDFRRIGDRELVPPVYIWPDVTDGKAFMAAGALSAYGLELIDQRNPALAPALIEARKSTEGLRQVARVVDSIRPGLYAELRRLEEGPEDFEKGLRAIKAAVA